MIWNFALKFVRKFSDQNIVDVFVFLLFIQFLFRFIFDSILNVMFPLKVLLLCVLYFQKSFLIEHTHSHLNVTKKKILNSFRTGSLTLTFSLLVFAAVFLFSFSLTSQRIFTCVIWIILLSSIVIHHTARLSNFNMYRRFEFWSSIT